MNNVGVRHHVRRKTRPHDVDPIKRGLGLDLIATDSIVQAVTLDAQLEVLGNLVLVDHPTDTQANLSLARQSSPPHHRLHLVQFDLGGVDELYALLRAPLLQFRIATCDEPLPGVLQRLKCEQVLLVEQPELLS